jgi:abhydrolase domain-containing protein 12
MPWVETEELFKSTMKAAIDATSPHDDIPKDMQVVDLGEAGRQEVWRSGSRTIQKTIAKHGGECFPIRPYASANVPNLQCRTKVTGRLQRFV